MKRRARFRATLTVAVATAVSVVLPLAVRDAVAQAPARTQAAPRCGDLATQSQMNACFAREATRVSALLDMLLGELRPSLKAAERKALDDVQRHWTRYRDAHCNWVASASAGGTIQPTVRATCLAGVTWERIGELKLALCEGGAGLGSPCAASRRYDQPLDR
jgi:uncharacterized protein YecT (DUF1311 family)